MVSILSCYPVREYKGEWRIEPPMGVLEGLSRSTLSRISMLSESSVNV